MEEFCSLFSKCAASSIDKCKMEDVFNEQKNRIKCPLLFFQLFLKSMKELCLIKRILFFWKLFISITLFFIYLIIWYIYIYYIIYLYIYMIDIHDIHISKKVFRAHICRMKGWLYVIIRCHIRVSERIHTL